ncbi:MAG: hypothetical protein ABSB88_07970 [Bryobacteraceae bacterium]|jgi:hypothetical protein
MYIYQINSNLLINLDQITHIRHEAGFEIYLAGVADPICITEPEAIDKIMSKIQTLSLS